MEFCKSAQEEVKWNRKITYPLRKRRERLKPQEMERLKSFFRGNLYRIARFEEINRTFEEFGSFRRI